MKRLMFYLTRLSLQLSMLLVALAIVLALFIVPYVWIVALIIVIHLAFKSRVSLSAYGTATWAAYSDIEPLFSGEGLVLGQFDGELTFFARLKRLFNRGLPAKLAIQKFFGPGKKDKPILRLSTSVHTAVFAPTGVGKGVSCVVPFLLTCRDSVIVIDFKGENTKITAQARRKMGHRVIVLDPFASVGRCDTFNPLAFINPDSLTALDDCRCLAEALVIRTGQEKEPHWNDSAEVWITAMIAVTVCFADDHTRNLQSVRTLLTDPARMAAAIKMMCESTAWEGLLARLGNQLLAYKDKELSSTLTTTNRFLRFLDTIPIVANTKRSSFNPAELLKGKMTVYLVLPPEHMRTQSALLRLWVGSLLRILVKGGLQDRRKVHLVLDEAASLGHMDALNDAVDKYRGYSLCIQFYYQSLGQLKKCWPEGQDQTLLSNTTQVFFGVNDQQTAEYVSNRLGEQTIVVDSGGTSYGGSSQNSQSSGGGSSSNSSSWNTSSNWSQAARKLLRPEEVTALNERIAISFVPGCRPIWTTLLRYYEKEFKVNRQIGLLNAMFTTAYMFLASALMAGMFAWLLLNERSW